MTNSDISADFPFNSKYIEVHGSTMHYIEEGEGDPILFLHGNPTSSYLWRNIIPHVTHLGRCIAPDLIGMGKSDKPDIDYRFIDHSKYIDGFIEALHLRDIAFVIHDWGSALGFYYAMRNEDNVRAIAFMEAILTPAPSWDMFPKDFIEIFKSFRTPDLGWDLIVNKNVFVEKILPHGVIRDLSKEEMDFYREPFKIPESRKPLWRWPNELPINGEPADVATIVAAYNEWLQKTDIPKLLFYVSPGALVRESDVAWCRENLSNLITVDLGDGIHFIQEDHPHEIGEGLAKWLEGSPAD